MQSEWAALTLLVSFFILSSESKIFAWVLASEAEIFAWVLASEAEIFAWVLASEAKITSINSAFPFVQGGEA